MREFYDRVIVITGAGSGIGRALAQAFAGEGANLALNDVNELALSETVQLINVRPTSVYQQAFDVSNREAMFGFATAVKARWGHIDIMINNAGMGLGDYDFDRLDLALFERVMNTNFYGVLYGSKAFIPHLLEQPEAVLVNISSVFGLTGIAKASPYCSSKFAVHGLNQCLIQEFRNTNLTLISVHPGGIKTNIAKNSPDYNATHDAFHNQFLKLSPEYAAKKIIEGIKKKKNRVLIGMEAYQLDLLTRLFPMLGGRIVNAIIKRKVDAAKKLISSNNI